MATNDVEWKLVSLDEVRVESIQDEDIVELGGIGEIRPVETICHVHLVCACVNMRFAFIGFVLWNAYVKIYRIQE